MPCRQENSSGVLSSRLASDTLHLRGAVGDVLGLIALNLFNLAFGFLIAYAYNWRMALLVTALLPVVSTAGYFHIKFAVQSQGSVDEMYASSNQSITESLASIRVIQAYNLQVGDAEGMGMEFGHACLAWLGQLNMAMQSGSVQSGLCDQSLRGVQSIVCVIDATGRGIGTWSMAQALARCFSAGVQSCQLCPACLILHTQCTHTPHHTGSVAWHGALTIQPVECWPHTYPGQQPRSRAALRYALSAAPCCQDHVLAMYARSLAAIADKVLVSSNTAGAANGYANFIMLGIYSLIVWFGAQEIK
jgi:ABC-type multidrug transport system fused ATPase/permease subunit